MTIKQQLEELLSLDSPTNYNRWEDVAEGLMDEFSDEDAERFANDIGEYCEEWWDAHADEANDEDE